jgi:hypothetical protein
MNRRSRQTSSQQDEIDDVDDHANIDDYIISTATIAIMNILRSQTKKKVRLIQPARADSLNTMTEAPSPGWLWCNQQEYRAVLHISVIIVVMWHV